MQNNSSPPSAFLLFRFQQNYFYYPVIQLKKVITGVVVMKTGNENWAIFKQNLELILYRHDLQLEGTKSMDSGEQWIISSPDFERLLLDIYPGKYETRCVPRPKDNPLFLKIYSDIEALRLVSVPSYPDYIGTDESGKGDFFGPLVIAGFHSNQKIDAELYKLGMKDSKKMDDAAVCQMSKTIQELFPDRFYILSLEPERYNTWYSQGRLAGSNLNHLLAKGHAMVIEELLESGIQTEIILADLFGDPEYIQNALYQSGQKLSLIETEHASLQMGVAAAGVLARETFLTWLKQHSELYALDIPKGASTKAIEAGKLLLARYGRDALKKTCKLHFKTLKQVII